jgi:zinc transport system ATP-binding protein
VDAPVIEIRHVSFTYDGLLALEDVDLAIADRDFVSVVGPNGGGKTTLLKLVLGLLVPTRGTIRVFGLPPEQARPRIGYLPQNVQVDLRFPVSVMDVVLMGRLSPSRWAGPFRRGDREAAERALSEVRLLELRDRPFSVLSGGQRQRALIARALAAEPDLLLMDEPTASLDIAAEQELYDLLDGLNDRLTIVLVSHDIGFVSQVVKTVVCVKRRVVVHPTSEITGEITDEIIREVYGGEMRLIRHDRHCTQGELFPEAEGGHAHG